MNEVQAYTCAHGTLGRSLIASGVILTTVLSAALFALFDQPGIFGLVLQEPVRPLDVALGPVRPLELVVTANENLQSSTLRDEMKDANVELPIPGSPAHAQVAVVATRNEVFLGKAVPNEIPADSKVLKVAFMDFWGGFEGSHEKRFFLDLLSSAGRRSSPPFRLEEDETAFEVLIISIFGTAHESFPSTPKVIFTGENRVISGVPGAFLTLGMEYRPEDDAYIRLPLWALDVSWFREQREEVDPMSLAPLRLESCIYPSTVVERDRFCAFIVNHCGVPERDSAFNKVNSWKPVDSPGGCMHDADPFPGYTWAKVLYLRHYRFSISYENTASPGYLTEKLLHVKVAGAVPIYWGDVRVAEDFDPKGFINANELTEDEMLAEVKRLESNNSEWRRMAQVAERVLGVSVEIDTDAWEYPPFMNSTAQGDQDPAGGPGG